MYQAIDKIKAEQLARIDWIEKESILAWLRSQEDEEMETHCQEVSEPGSGVVDNKSRTQHTRKGQVGNEKFLARISWCVEQRFKIIGAYAPTKIAPTDPSGQLPYDKAVRELTDDQVAALEAARARLTSVSLN